jgi:hypothetical protein
VSFVKIKKKMEGQIEINFFAVAVNRSWRPGSIEGNEGK